MLPASGSRGRLVGAGRTWSLTCVVESQEIEGQRSINCTGVKSKEYEHSPRAQYKDRPLSMSSYIWLISIGSHTVPDFHFTTYTHVSRL